LASLSRPFSALSGARGKNYSFAPECLENERLRLVKYPGEAGKVNNDLKLKMI
jgi:hypothetical protein